MLGKLSKPVAGKFSGNKVDCGSGATSPRSPLDMKSHSPRGLKSYDLGGVGLGIVAALEKSDNFGGRFQACKALCNKNLNRSNPIPVNSGNNSGRFGCTRNEQIEMESSLEEYTFVTCRGFDNKSSYTKVFFDGGEYCGGRKVTDWTNLDRGVLKENKKATVFDISPAKFGDFGAYPDSDFLNSCHLCHKNLHGKDIFMYRGEKAFCSSECRYSQIVMDERKEKCSSKASRSSVDVSTSPFTSEQIFSTGIFAI
ncbi:hypothetical protein LIER_21704 [Lithospermum erythrorhizon]|uniref:FLZ-type domain-containing protein n=1 Tax=Lithospermum erythrorhizon TaxID=34254 RepID=A0AAV3QUA3_LITER